MTMGEASPLEKALTESVLRIFQTPCCNLTGMLCTDGHGRPLSSCGTLSVDSAAVISQLIQASVLIHPNLRPPIVTLVGHESRVICACNRNIFIAVHRGLSIPETDSSVSPVGSDSLDAPDTNE